MTKREFMEELNNSETIKGLDFQIAQVQTLLETLKKEKEQEIANVQLECQKKEEERTIKQLEFYRKFEFNDDTDGIEYAVDATLSPLIEIKDTIFIQKRQNYREAATELRKYVWSKIKELESMNGSYPS
jgi:hypothetical protein